MVFELPGSSMASSSSSHPCAFMASVPLSATAPNPAPTSVNSVPFASNLIPMALKLDRVITFHIGDLKFYLLSVLIVLKVFSLAPFSLLHNTLILLMALVIKLKLLILSFNCGFAMINFNVLATRFHNSWHA